MLALDPSLKGRLRFDEFANRIDHDGLPGGQEPGPWNDADAARLARWMQERDVLVRPGTVQTAALVVAQERRHHPVRDWLRSLRWDGKPRLDDWLCRYVGAAGNPYTRAIGRKFLISAVARAIRPGCKVDCALILEGPQGAGKSSVARILAHNSDWFADEMADLGSKDAAQGVVGKWIIELAELSAMKRSEVERVKAFFSRSTDTYRPSYGRVAQDFPRHCVFIGTTNSDQYLADETGNRRFWPVKVGNIDLPALKSVVSQLWAEAVVAFRANEQWWLPREIEALAAEEQAGRAIVDAWMEPVRKWLGERFVPFTIDEALRQAVTMIGAQHDPIATRRMAAVLHQLGWERFRHREGTALIWKYRRVVPTVPTAVPTDPASMWEQNYAKSESGFIEENSRVPTVPTESAKSVTEHIGQASDDDDQDELGEWLRGGRVSNSRVSPESSGNNGNSGNTLGKSLGKNNFGVPTGPRKQWEQPAGSGNNPPRQRPVTTMRPDTSPKVAP